MWTENKRFKEDLEYITSVNFIDWHKLDNKTIFITGATGLIGYTFASALLYRNLVYNSNIKVIALVRNITKSKEKFAEQLKQNANIEFVVGDVENIPCINEDIDYIVCHQANRRIIDSVIRQMKAPAEKFYMNLQHYGNTSAASIPLALADMQQQNLLRPGAKLLCVGFGGGFTWGASLVCWKEKE